MREKTPDIPDIRDCRYFKLEKNPAFKNSRLSRAMLVIEIPLGYSASFVQFPKQSPTISLTIANTRRAASGFPYTFSTEMITPLTK